MELFVNKNNSNEKNIKFDNCTRKVVFAFVVLICFYWNSDAQDVKNDEFVMRLNGKADGLKTAIQFEKAIAVRRNLFDIENENVSNNYELAGLYSLTGKTDSAFYFLIRATAKDSSITFLTNSDFYFVLDDERWAKIREYQIEKYEDANGEIANWPMAILLWEMLMKDQAYYSFMDDTKPEEAEIYWQLKDSLNRENLQKLDSVVQVNGWPKKTEVGEKAGTAAFLIIQHADFDTQKRYFPQLRSAAKKGEALKRHLALLIDRIRIQQNKKQIYGSQVHFDFERNKYYIDYENIKNPARINKRREKMGLNRIEEYLKTWNIEWDYQK